MDDTQQLRTTKLTLLTLFLGILATFASRVVRPETSLRVTPLDLVMLGLATFRMGRMVAYESVTAPLREGFTETRDDASGAGQTVVASGSGWRHVLGELLSCPICAGTWVAAGLVYGLHLAPAPTRLLVAIMSAVGLAQMVNSIAEAFDWSARAARSRCGA